MITAEMLAAAAAELNSAMLRNLPEPFECTHQFSSKFERKMKRVLRRGNHPIRYRITQRAASFVLISFLSFMTLITISPTVRAAVFGWIREQYEYFTQYYFTGTAQENVKIKNCLLSYIPDGYIEWYRSEKPDSTTIYYINNSTNELLYFTYSKNHESIEYYFHSDQSTSQEIVINGEIYELYESSSNEQASILLWSDRKTNTFFGISAFIEKAEFMKIIENIKIIYN